MNALMWSVIMMCFGGGGRNLSSSNSSLSLTLFREACIGSTFSKYSDLTSKPIAFPFVQTCLA